MCSNVHLGRTFYMRSTWISFTFVLKYQKIPLDQIILLSRFWQLIGKHCLPFCDSLHSSSDLLISSLGKTQCIVMLHACHMVANPVIHINSSDQLHPRNNLPRWTLAYVLTSESEVPHINKKKIYILIGDPNNCRFSCFKLWLKLFFFFFYNSYHFY